LFLLFLIYGGVIARRLEDTLRQTTRYQFLSRKQVCPKAKERQRKSHRGVGEKIENSPKGKTPRQPRAFCVFSLEANHKDKNRDKLFPRFA